MPFKPPKPPEIVARELIYPRRDIWVLLAVAFVTRLFLLPWNKGEYTDGVLQVLQLVDPNGIWPPVYTILVYPLSYLIGYEWSGRLVSAAASSLAIYPLYRMTQRAFGTRAALYAGIFYLTAPVAMRWSVRMMTEPTFCLFFWWACERMCFLSDERQEKPARRALMFAALFAALAALTRYQGLMLLPPLAICAIVVWKRFGKPPVVSLWPLALFLLLPLWGWLAGFIHDDQFIERSLGSDKHTGLTILLNAEPFVLLTPYFLTYPVFIVAMVGMFWTRMRRGPFFGWLMLYTTLVLLLAQSAFGSFQERYFLPLHGFFWVVAGSGMYALQERWYRTGRRYSLRRAFPYMMVGTYAYSALFAFLVFWGHREAFGDLADASRWVRKNTDEDARVFTNEIYRDNPPISGNKVRFYSQRRTDYLNESHVSFRMGPDGQPEFRPPAHTIPDGSLIILSDIYGGEFFEQYLRRYYVLDPAVEEPFRASILPLFPDVMGVQSRFGAQNPMAWHERYHWQVFETMVWRVRERRP